MATAVCGGCARRGKEERVERREERGERLPKGRRRNNVRQMNVCGSERPSLFYCFPFLSFLFLSLIRCYEWWNGKFAPFIWVLVARDRHVTCFPSKMLNTVNDWTK